MGTNYLNDFFLDLRRREERKRLERFEEYFKKKFKRGKLSSWVCCAKDELNFYDYDFLGVSGERLGDFVYKVREKKTREITTVHVKVTPSAAYYNILETLFRPETHPSIVTFKVKQERGIHIVIAEIQETDLRRYIVQNTFTKACVKKLLKQLLEGVMFLHENGVMHRDLNPDNLFITKDGDLKIWNFGSATRFGEANITRHLSRVGTLWYRAPEMLARKWSDVALGTVYSSEVDMWSVGCIMAEFVLNKVMFRGKDEEDQLKEIHRILNPFSNKRSQSISYANFVLKEDGFDLLKGLLSYDPTKRLTPQSALNHIWFQN